MGGHKSSSHDRKRSTRSLARNIDKYTKEGTASIEAGKLQAAMERFELAYTHAMELAEGFTIRSCAFNLGAVHIAAGNPSKGLEILHSALPPPNQHDGRSNGDLFYNFALGYDALNNLIEAGRYLELALEEYLLEKDNFKMEAEITSKMAAIYTKQHEWLRAARANGIAAHAHAMLAEHEKQAMATCHEASCLYRGNRPDLALQMADDCMLLCQKVHESEVLSRLYNELGLTYTQCAEFGKAATCLELALPFSRDAGSDMKQAAISLQNLGAVYNSLLDFQRAIPLHKEAARNYAELNDRNGQCRCFTNMAFAYSQVGDMERAGECYLHAMQASQDTGDRHTQWQALEGLGTVAYNQGQCERAVQRFKQALSVLSGPEHNDVAQERIIAKLTDSIHTMACAAEPQPSSPSGMVDIFVNGEPRPPTRDEQRQMAELAEQRKEKRRLGKRQNQFTPVALGVTDYDTDSDISLERDRRIARSRSKRGSRKLERSSSLASPRPAVSERNDSTESERPTQHHRNLTPATGRRDLVDGRTSVGRYQHPLLRTSSFDSDEERNRLINEPRRGSPARHKAPKKALAVDSEWQPEVGGQEPEVHHVTAADMARQRRSDSLTTRSTVTAGYLSGDSGQAGTDRGVVQMSPMVTQPVTDLSETDDVTGSESGSKESDTDDDDLSRKMTLTLLPPAPPIPINSPNSTYLQPTAEPSHQGEGQTRAEARPTAQAVNVDIGDDPIYQTIRSGNRTLEVPIEIHPGHYDPGDISEAPALPPRLALQQMNGSESQVFPPYSGQHQEEQMQNDEDNFLQKRGQGGKRASKTCIVM